MARLTHIERVGWLQPTGWNRFPGTALLLGLLAWTGLAMAQPAETADRSGAPEREGAEPVACLLPASIDRFGQQLTIVGARQRIETSRADCQARSGEVIDQREPATEEPRSMR